MILESVDRNLVLAILEAIAVSHPRWKEPEPVWKGFEDWAQKRRRDLPGSLKHIRILYHQLQDLYEFAVEACKAESEETVLRRCGRSLAEYLLRDRLSDLLAHTLSARDDVGPALESLFLLFMHQYGPYVFQCETSRKREELSLILRFARPDSIREYLESYKKTSAESFQRSFLMIQGAVEGCLEYLLEPWDPASVSSNVQEGLIRVHLPTGTRFNYPRFVGSLTDYARRVQDRYQGEILALDMESDLILQSESLRKQWHRLRVASTSDEIILLRGEPGTGKTYLARRIHEISPRKSGPFVEVGLTSDLGSENMVQSDLFGHVKGAFTGALEDKQGLFSLAHKGTIFLDEIGDAGPDLQAKLLRVIERKVFKPLGSNKDITVDVRIVTATNKDLEAKVRDGSFREDLFHRINVIPFVLPPLRERLAEIPLISKHFIRRLSLELRKPEKGVSSEVECLFLAYPWPGNLRELIHVLKHALLFSEGASIIAQDLPDHVKTRSGVTRLKMAKAPEPGVSPAPIIDFIELCEALARVDGTPIDRNHAADHAWHVEYAKKTYLHALIKQFKGNLRKVTSFWEHASINTVRSLIKKYGLESELEGARKKQESSE